MEHMTTPLKKAIALSKEIHKNDIRLSGKHLFYHIDGVAKQLINIGITDETTLILAYLHHATQSNDKYMATIQKLFGNDVINLLQSYDNLRQSEFREIVPSEVNKKYIIQTYFNLAKDKRILFVRIADKVDDIQTALYLSKEASAIAANRALHIYAPICHLLGISKFSHILEDTAFKIMNPHMFYTTRQEINQLIKGSQHHFNEFYNFITELLTELGIRAKLSKRTKSIYSYYQKKVRYCSNKDMRTIYDINAIRIIVDTIEECYYVEDLLKTLFDIMPNERDDYIQNPRHTGYQSIHNILKVTEQLYIEVQIRTIQMHEFAEYGVASHAFYKIGKNLEHYLLKNPKLLKELAEINSTITSNIAHFSDYIYVFTPKGDIKELPRGANLIDFAYAIHRDIGNHCVAGLVNGQIVKLNYILHDGDRVEIKTSPLRKAPTTEWLYSVKTKRAKNLIRKHLELG